MSASLGEKGTSSRQMVVNTPWEGGGRADDAPSAHPLRARLGAEVGWRCGWREDCEESQGAMLVCACVCSAHAASVSTFNRGVGSGPGAGRLCSLPQAKAAGVE